MNENLLNEGMKEAITERFLIEKKLTKNQYNRIRQYEQQHDVTLTTEEILSRVRLKEDCAK